MKREPANVGNPGRLLTNDYEKSASLKSAPDSKRGILAKWERERTKFYCPNHPETLQTVIDVSHDIKQLPTAAIYDALLSCGCRKIIAINVRLKKSSTEYRVPIIVDGTGLEGTI